MRESANIEELLAREVRIQASIEEARKQFRETCMANNLEEGRKYLVRIVVGEKPLMQFEDGSTKADSSLLGIEFNASSYIATFQKVMQRVAGREITLTMLRTLE